MNRRLHAFSIALALSCAAAGPFLTNCAAPDASEEQLGEDEVTGVNNALGLRLTYDATTSQVKATLRDSLKPGEQLRIRVRRGMPTLTSQKELKCADLHEARPITDVTPKSAGASAVVGRVIYDGPKVDASLIDLLKIYDDHRFQSDPRWAAQRIREIRDAGGPRVLVEACIVKGETVRAKLQTPLEYAWDEGVKAEKAIKKANAGGGIRILAQDAGGGGGEGEDGGTVAEPPGREQPIRSMEQYGEKCVAELGEIPFFKKLADGKYDTFDCRDFMGNGEGHEPASMPNVEGSLIPLTQHDKPVTKCDGEGEHGQKDSSSYDCVGKCDKAEFLSEGCEPGPTVTHAKNEQGTHWTLLCRKVSGGEEKGWLKTKRFDDIAMIGHNPKNGKTCFFQNMIGSGDDGEHVPHPADVEKSRTLWDSPKGYCFESCHSTDAFIQSPWINGAKKANNKPVVPMMGFESDFEISWLESPYYVINMDAQGWTIPKQLVSEEAGPCMSCHRVGGETWMRQFANWTTGTAADGVAISDRDSYWSKISDPYKKFEKSHWMPMRLDGISEATWPTSKWAQAMQFINKCQQRSDDPACLWADVPRGEENPQRPR